MCKGLHRWAKIVHIVVPTLLQGPKIHRSHEGRGAYSHDLHELELSFRTRARTEGTARGRPVGHKPRVRQIGWLATDRGGEEASVDRCLWPRLSLAQLAVVQEMGIEKS